MAGLCLQQRFDPRYDERCGEFDQYLFNYSYGFVDDLKAEEKQVRNIKFSKYVKNAEKTLSRQSITLSSTFYRYFVRSYIFFYCLYFNIYYILYI